MAARLTKEEKREANRHNVEWLRLSNKILRAMPGSPAQRELQEALKAVPRFKDRGQKVKRLILNVNGTMRYANRELVKSIVADFKARGVATARIYSVPMYGVEVTDAEWEAAKTVNAARIETKRRERR